MPKNALNVPAGLRIRDAITRMNETFQTSALVVNASGDVLGILDGESLSRRMQVDADALLQSRCVDLLMPRGIPAAA